MVRANGHYDPLFPYYFILMLEWLATFRMQTEHNPSPLSAMFYLRAPGIGNVDSGATAHMTSSPDNVCPMSAPSFGVNAVFIFTVMVMLYLVSHIDATFLKSRPPIQGLIFESCGLCPVPTTAAEPIHEPDSTPSSPYSSEDDNPPTDSDDVSSHGAPPATSATCSYEPSFSFSLVTAKGIKSAAKHPQWMAAIA
ncbi:hypothetical protein Tco_0564189 [Tanacetum coccineum]